MDDVWHTKGDTHTHTTFVRRCFAVCLNSSGKLYAYNNKLCTSTHTGRKKAIDFVIPLVCPHEIEGRRGWSQGCGLTPGPIHISVLCVPVQ